MGQDITVTQTPSGRDDAHIYSLNRSLTGMEIIVFDNPDMVVDTNDASSVLAKRILDFGVESVSIYSNIVTVNCDPSLFAKIENQITETIENLFNFYGDAAGWAVPATA